MIRRWWLTARVRKAAALRRLGVETRGVFVPLHVLTALTALVGAAAAVGFTNTLEAEILDHVLNDGTYTPPANWFVGTSTTTPTEAGANFTEPVGNNYGRVSTAAADWAAAVAGDPTVKDNANAITFPTASGSQGTQTHFGLFIAASGGTVRMWGALDVSKAVGAGDTASFGVGVLDVKLGDPTDTY